MSGSEFKKIHEDVGLRSAILVVNDMITKELPA
jgi:hypothetical protein